MQNADYYFANTDSDIPLNVLGITQESSLYQEFEAAGLTNEDGTVFGQALIDERGRRINERKKAKTAPKSIAEAYGERVAANLEKERPAPKRNKNKDNSVLQQEAEDDIISEENAVRSEENGSTNTDVLEGRKVSTSSSELKGAIEKLNNDIDVSNEELEGIPQIRELLDEVAKRPETYTINTSERRIIRKKVLKKLLSLGSAQVDSNGKIVYNGDIKQERRADIVIGLSAAGKSSVFVDPLSYIYSSRVIDSDMAKEELPEFDNGMGANAVHRESQDIIDDLLDIVTKRGDNIVWPVVGGNNVQSTIDKIQDLKDNGYTVYLHLNELSNNKAVGRSLNRYVETGRFIPPAIIKNYGDTPTQNFNKIINMEGLVDGYSHYSNDVARGEEPRLIKISENVREFDERRRQLDEEKKRARTQKATESTQVEADPIDGPAFDLPENEQTADNAANTDGDSVSAPENTNAVTKPIEQYSKEWQQVIKGYLSATSKRLMRLIEIIKSGNTKFMRQKICDVSARAAKDIKALLGIDVTGYTHDINTNGVQHILKRHGENGTHDSTMANDEDIARVGWVLENYDTVEVLYEKGEQAKSSEFRDKNNNPATQIRYIKKIDGTYYVVEAVADNSYKKLWVQSVYLQKNKEDVTQAPDADNVAPETTAETAPPSPSSKPIISNEGGKVTTKTAQFV